MATCDLAGDCEVSDALSTPGGRCKRDSEDAFGPVLSSIRVAVRLRPLNELERSSRLCLRADEAKCNNDLETNEIQVIGNDGTNGNLLRRFRFDHVLGMKSTQEEVYKTTALPLVERCVDGYNATVLAYGQTGSGKTWTVGNTYTGDGAAEDVGIIPRAAVDLFKKLDELRVDGVQASVRASFLEVYNEEVKDLIGAGSVGATSRSSTSPCWGFGTPPRGQQSGVGGGGGGGGGLQLRETPEGDVTVVDLSQHKVSCTEDLCDLLRRGTMCRATASTAMNARSSRSHAIFTLSLQVVRPAVEGQEQRVSCSKLHLVDLAGSEGVGKNGVEGQRRREGIHINKGLLVLRKVISSLTRHAPKTPAGSMAMTARSAARVSPAPPAPIARRVTSPARVGGASISPGPVHVPYRESKLTRLLQSSLGGNAHTVMIACVSPSASNLAESLSTLRYAEGALSIKNLAVRNEGIIGAPATPSEVLALRKELRLMQLELMQARFSGPVGSGAAVNPAVHAATAEAVEKAAELRRGQDDLKRRVSEATRQAAAAAEAESSARMESERWRLQCEQLSTVLKGAAPSPASLGGVTPSWSAERRSIKGNNFREYNVSSAVSRVRMGGTGNDHCSFVDRRRETFPSTFGSGKKGGRHHQSHPSKIFSWIGGSKRENSENALNNGDCRSSCVWNSGGILRDGGSANIRANVLENRSMNDMFGYASANALSENGPEKVPVKNGTEQGLEEKMSDLEAYVGVLERELSDAREAATDTAVAATAAAAGIAGRVSTDSVFTATSSANIIGYDAVVSVQGDGNTTVRSTVENSPPIAAEVPIEYERKCGGSGVFWCEKKELDNVGIDGDDSRRDEKKLECPSSQIYREDRNSGGSDHSTSGSASRVRSGRAYEKYCAVKEAKKAEIVTWLAAEIEDAAAVERAKLALVEQVSLRGLASRRAQELRKEDQLSARVTPWSLFTEDDDEILEEGGEQQRKDAVEISELELKIDASSQVINDLRTYLDSAEVDKVNKSPVAGSRPSGKSRWSRLRTPWEIKAALSILMGEAVKARVVRSNITASLVERDSELRKLSHEVATLRLKVAAPEQHICAPNPQSAARDSDESIAIARKEKEGTKMGRNGGYSNRIKTAGPKIVVDRKERQADRDSDQQPDTTLEDNQELESTDKDDGLEGARPHSRSVVWGEEEERDLVCSTGGAEGGGDGVARIGFVSPISRNRRRPLPGRDGRDDGARRAGRGLEDEGDRTPPQPEVVDVILDKYMAEKRNSMTNAAISLASKAAIDWVNLDYYTIDELETLLRDNGIPASSAPKDVLIRRLKTALDIVPPLLEIQNLQRSSPDSVHSFSARPPPKTYDFSSESETDLSFSSTLTTPSACGSGSGRAGRVSGSDGDTGWIRSRRSVGSGGIGGSVQSSGGAEEIIIGDAGSEEQVEEDGEIMREDGGRESSPPSTGHNGRDADGDGVCCDEELPTTAERLFSSCLSSSSLCQEVLKSFEPTAAAARGAEDEERSYDASEVSRPGESSRPSPPTPPSTTSATESRSQTCQNFFDTFSPRAQGVSCCGSARENRHTRGNRYFFSMIGDQTPDSVCAAPSDRVALAATGKGANTSAAAGWQMQETESATAKTGELTVDGENRNRKVNRFNGGGASNDDGEGAGDGSVGVSLSLFTSKRSASLPIMVAVCACGSGSSSGGCCRNSGCSSPDGMCGALSRIRLGSGSLPIVCGVDDAVSSLGASDRKHREWTASGGESSGRSDAGMHGAKLEYLVGTINANNVPLSGARDSVALAHARADFSLYRDAVNDDEDMGEESAAALSGNSSSDFLALARARLDYTDSRYADDEGREGEATTYSVESNNEDDQLVSDGQDDVMNFEGTRDGDEDDDEQGDWSQHPTTSNAEEDGRDSDTATTTREVISWSILSDDELEAEINCRKQDEEIDESEDSDDSDFIYRLTTKSTSTASTSAASVLTSTSAATTKRTFSAISLLTSSSSAATRSFSTIAEEGTAESALGAVATAIQNSRRRSSSSSNNIDADRAAGAIVNEISPDVRKRSVVVTKQSQLAENKVSPAPRPISVATSSIATAAMKEVGKSRRSSADGGRREIGASPVIVSPLQLSPRLVVARRRPAEPLLLIAGDSDVESIAGSYSGGSNAASSAAMSRRFFESSPLQAPAPLLITTPTSAGSCGSRKSFRHPSDLPM